MGSVNRIRRFFDSLAPRYDGLKQRQEFYGQALQALAAELAGPAANGAALELGCGTGRLLRALAPSRGLGVDFSPAMIEQARSRPAPGIEYAVADIVSYLPPCAFNLVLCCDVLEHLPDIRPLFSNFRRYPGSPRFVLTWPNPRWFPAMRIGEWIGAKTPEGPLFERRLRAACRLAAQNGLRVERSGYRLLLPGGPRRLRDRLNQLHRDGLLRSWGLIQYLVLSK